MMRALLCLQFAVARFHYVPRNHLRFPGRIGTRHAVSKMSIFNKPCGETAHLASWRGASVATSLSWRACRPATSRAGTPRQPPFLHSIFAPILPYAGRFVYCYYSGVTKYSQIDGHGSGTDADEQRNAK